VYTEYVERFQDFRHGLRVLENRVLKKMFVPTRVEKIV